MDPRTLAARVLLRVEQDGAWSTQALDAALVRAKEMEPRDRGLATRLVYGTLAWRRRLDHALAQVVKRPLHRLDAGVLQVLRIGAYQLLIDDVPPHAAVDTAVRAVQRLGLGRAKGLVNASLRRVAGADPPTELADRASLPDWIAERWSARFGAERALSMGLALNEPPPGTIRAVDDRDAVAKVFDAEGRTVKRTPIASDGLVVSPFGGIVRHESFAQGRWTVQDEASMRVVELLDPQPGERILDLCSAPGGKATHIAARGATVDAVELHPHRGELVAGAAKRLGVADRVRVLVADGREYQAAEPYDRVLVDAPCSSLGVARRRPEVKWRVLPERLPALVTLQAELLAAGARNTRPGGTLVFATCSTEPEECEGGLEQFVSATDAPWEAEGRLRTWPDEGEPPSDGFFAARLRRPG